MACQSQKPEDGEPFTGDRSGCERLAVHKKSAGQQAATRGPVSPPRRGQQQQHPPSGEVQQPARRRARKRGPAAQQRSSQRLQEFQQNKRGAARREQLAALLWRGVRNIRLARLWKVHNEWTAARQAAPMQLEPSGSSTASAGPSGAAPPPAEPAGDDAAPIAQQELDDDDCCEMPGCSWPRYEDSSGRRHRCCSRTCARELARLERDDVCDALSLDAEARGSRKSRHKPKGAHASAKRAAHAQPSGGRP